MNNNKFLQVVLSPVVYVSNIVNATLAWLDEDVSFGVDIVPSTRLLGNDPSQFQSPEDVSKYLAKIKAAKYFEKDVIHTTKFRAIDSGCPSPANSVNSLNA